MLRTNDASNRRAIESTCSACSITWIRRYRPDQGTMCKSCTSRISVAKGVATIKAKPKVGKSCKGCGKFSYWIQRSDYCKNCSPQLRGSQHYNWKGGKTTSDRTERMRFRNLLQQKILQRDNYTCQVCDVYGGHLQVDHIKRWSEYSELRFDETNCRTLCMACHYYITFKRKLPQGVVWGHNLSQRIIK